MRNDMAIPDPKRHELFTLHGGDMDGADNYHMDGEELVTLVTDFMDTAMVFTMEDYPVTVDEAIGFIETSLGLNVRQLSIKDYKRLDITAEAS